MESLSLGTVSQQVLVPAGQELSWAKASEISDLKHITDHEVMQGCQGQEACTHLTMQVAPGIHQKIETAHLLGSLSLPVHGLLSGLWRKPQVRGTEPAPPLGSAIASSLLPRDCKSKEYRWKFFAVFSIWFFLYLLLSLLSLVRDIQNIFNLIFGFENAVRPVY